MNPVVLVSCDFVKTGGMDRANYALASYLARAGHEVHAVGHAIGEELAREPNVTFHRVRKPLGSYLLGERLLKKTGVKIAQNLSPRGARVLVNGGNCPWGDINWVHYVHAAYTPSTATGLLRRFKQSVSHRSFLAGERKAIGRARLVIANSERTKRHLIENLGVAEDRIRVVYYGIDPDRFRPASDAERRDARAALGWDDRPVLTFIGALGDRRKGFDTLLDAWKLRSADPSWDARLFVIGHGAELPLWKQRVESLGLSRSIDFLGFRRDVPDLLRASDAMVHPARYEAYGLGVHEALCCGLPAIVSAGAGVAERYPAALSDLLLPHPENAAELAEKLSVWRAHHGRYRQAAIDLSLVLRAEDWDTMARRMASMMMEGAPGTCAPQSTATSHRPTAIESETYA